MVRLALAMTILGATLSAQDVRLTRISAGLVNPTDIQSAGDGSGRLFFLEQNGRIRVYRDGTLLSTPFLDISAKTVGGGERGLLGLAFPPDYANKRYFYINYTDRQGDTTISRFRVSTSSDVADPNSEAILMTVNQPFSNHNGGQLRFGPDGYLYIGLGDGGSAGDPQGNGQNRRARLGKMLRVDVESNLNEVRVPPGNPFVNNPAALPEIWALGLRNPWRYSFDRVTGDLWIADVGQNRAEEVNFQPASSRGGENYGWNPMEGLQCFVRGCNPSSFTLPVLEYPRSEGCSVTGGHVYRGSQWTNLRGLYIYGDYCTGRIWGLRREGERWVNALLLETGMQISTFGEGEDGEIYVANHSSGEIFHITGTRLPTFTTASVVNAASNVAGLVPGSLATVYVAGVRDTEGITAAETIPLPESLGDVRVTVNGRVAPLHAVTRLNGVEQVNFQTPFETSSNEPARVIVTRGGVSSAPVPAQVLAMQPGVFSFDGTNAIVVHADNTYVTRDRPLAGGEGVYFYATGLGGVENNPGTGRAGPHDPLARTVTLPTVTIGNVAAEVFFSGIAPGFVGVYQVNARAPQGLPAGEYDLVVRAGGVASRPVKIPVR